MRKSHVRFLGEGRGVTLEPHPTQTQLEFQSKTQTEAQLCRQKAVVLDAG